MRRVIKHSYHLLSQELAHTDSTVCRGIIVEQRLFSSPMKLWPNPPVSLYQSVQNCLVKCDINVLTCRNNFLMDNAFVVEEGGQHCFDHGFLQTSLFGRGEVCEHHAIDCRFHSGSNW